MDVVVRAMRPADHPAWARMRSELWPDDPALPHLEEIASLLRDADSWAFLAETTDGQPAGFAEVSLRTCANGCNSRPVPFLEGIWVEVPFRRRGVGASLIQHIETFLVARGFREWGSDTAIDNGRSHAAHARWGFTEVERVICYRKAFPTATHKNA
jgi:aminoglycoside 6'-N-acetyltransferase I